MNYEFWISTLVKLKLYTLDPLFELSWAGKVNFLDISPRIFLYKS